MAEDIKMDFPLRPEKEGLMETITIVPVVQDNPEGELKVYTHLRNFKVMGTLYSIPPIWNSQIVAGKLEGGTTLLKASETEYQSYDMEVTGARKFTVHLNQFKQLSSVSCTIAAKSWQEALQVFHDMIDPYLSLMSWRYHVPLVLSNVNGTDTETTYQYAKFIQSIPEKLFSLTQEPVERYTEHIAALFSFHREMVNSTSGPYRLLCIHKCLTLVNQFKSVTHDEVKKMGLDLKQYKTETEVKIEDNEINKSVWPETIGWNLGRLLADKLRPMRNKIAHELDEGDKYANPDNGLFQEQIRDYADAALPLMRLQFKKIIDYRVKYQVITK
ncbi:hypothetical protein [Mucilaginibacter polytrichastri]|uniref:ApeA N-terminal domain-containing protein n=1 Tax=Mucilaginibacter polytrichastri TaxID=1302689 RepID=A0A1Q6A3W6_9SPHI|nr:hypothetical protein [Mucilaginibacter polytrichastri]OKS88701.1 hypothetical protein RG47T_4179 [Mucilaginibacter polytrichastri]SFT04602.1 hypothetical protein SAMN04487890_10933 [Mucilaginibacter polytrichastri]